VSIRLDVPTIPADATAAEAWQIADEFAAAVDALRRDPDAAACLDAMCAAHSIEDPVEWMNTMVELTFGPKPEPSA
jgi:hypothetical protein